MGWLIDDIRVGAGVVMGAVAGRSERAGGTAAAGFPSAGAVRDTSNASVRTGAAGGGGVACLAGADGTEAAGCTEPAPERPR